ncbi:MAG: TfpX/TfpZ family type IV pilin accessory protein [Tahibacter sp.]
MSRWKAAAIHLSISAAIGLFVGILLFGVWYPPPYFHAAGADELVVLLVGVDVVLGPLLTLVVFKSGKKGMKFDLAVIAITQTCALVYGMSVVFRTRPVFLVAAIDRFVLVAANEIDPADLIAGSKPEFRSLSWFGPRTVSVKLPPISKERDDLMFSGLAGKDVDKFPKFYVEYTEGVADILKSAMPLDALKTPDPTTEKLLAEAVDGTKIARDRLVWVPIMVNKASLTMLLERDSGKPLNAVAIDPWPSVQHR